MYDTVDRITWVGKAKGRRDKYHEFFPCWDWKPTQITEYIEQFDISLSLDYLLDKTSQESIPLLATLVNMREIFPEDYQRLKLFFPFIEARLARNEFRKRKLERKSQWQKKKRIATS